MAKQFNPTTSPGEHARPGRSRVRPAPGSGASGAQPGSLLLRAPDIFREARKMAPGAGALPRAGRNRGRHLFFRLIPSGNWNQYLNHERTHH